MPVALTDLALFPLCVRIFQKEPQQSWWPEPPQDSHGLLACCEKSFEKNAKKNCEKSYKSEGSNLFIQYFSVSRNNWFFNVT